MTGRRVGQSSPPHPAQSASFLRRGWAPSARSSIEFLRVCTSPLLFAPSLFISLPPLTSLHIPPPLLLLSQHKRVSPALISHPHSPTLSLALFISDKNSTCTIRQIPSSTCSRLAHHPPPGPCVINSSSASSSPSASIVFVFHLCHHPIDAVAFGCRLYPGHQHQRHRF